MSIKPYLETDIIQLYRPYEHLGDNLETLIEGQIFVLPRRYKPVKKVGAGSYSVVIIARDQECKEEDQSFVAIKKMTNVFDHVVFAKRILRQLKILRLLKHQNLVELKEIILPPSRKDFDSIYCVFQLIEKDLQHLIRAPLQVINTCSQLIIYQILRGLKYIHSAQIIHRDLKPRNILIDSNCDVKICDFGFSRHIKDTMAIQYLTDYVSTRWYRAPEVLMGEIEYSPAIDIWSVGCIIVELLTQKPFLHGKTTSAQISLIFQLLQVTQAQVNQLEWKNVKEKLLEAKVKILPKQKKRNFLKEKLSKLDPQCADLIIKMLKFDPNQRITALQALEHPYLKNFHLQQDEPVREEPISPKEFEFQQHKLSLQQLKDILYEEILLYHFPEFRASYDQKIRNNKSVITHIILNSNSRMKNPASESETFDQESSE